MSKKQECNEKSQQFERVITNGFKLKITTQEPLAAFVRFFFYFIKLFLSFLRHDSWCSTIV